MVENIELDNRNGRPVSLETQNLLNFLVKYKHNRTRGARRAEHSAAASREVISFEYEGKA